MAKYYAVLNGKNPGIYTSWDECKKQTMGFPNALFKGFDTKGEAEKFINAGNKAYSEDDENVETLSFVDGSFNKKTNTYGYGGFIIHKDESGEKIKTIVQGSGKDPDMVTMRNIAGEILGAQAAIQKAIDLGYKTISVFYDYIGIEMWATGEWNRNKQGTIDYFNFIQSVKNKIDIKFVKVKGHTGIEGNEEVDKLAKQACGVI